MQCMDNTSQGQAVQMHFSCVFNCLCTSFKGQSNGQYISATSEWLHNRCMHAAWCWVKYVADTFACTMHIYSTHTMGAVFKNQSSVGQVMSRMKQLYQELQIAGL